MKAAKSLRFEKVSMSWLDRAWKSIERALEVDDRKRPRAAIPVPPDAQRKIWYVTAGDTSLGPMAWRQAENIRRGYGSGAHVRRK